MLYAIRGLLFFFVASMVFSEALAAKIEWSVEHPFRFFRHQSDLQLQRDALAELQSRNPDAAAHAPISHIERILNNPGNWTDEFKNRLRRLHSADTIAKNVRLDPRLGWASLLRSSNNGPIDGTCWDEDTQQHSRCRDQELLGTTGTGSYLRPRFHRVELRLTGDDWSGQLCDWQADQEALIDEAGGAEVRQISGADCAKPLVIRAWSKWSDRNPVTKVSVRVQGDSRVVPAASVRVDDYLVVAFGDSYSSGEGNPEVPAALARDKAIGSSRSTPLDADEDELGWREIFGVPTRKYFGSAARWLDRRCHRSVYSYQTRVALQLAIAPGKDGKHHHAVTYLHYACSGAEITEDMLFGWEGRECLGNAASYEVQQGAGGSSHRSIWGWKHRYYAPQISRAVIEICNGQAQYRWLHEAAGDPQLRLLRSPLVDDYRTQRVQDNYPDPQCGLKRDRSFWDKPKIVQCQGELSRSVDLVLSSMGGNDVGFSGVVGNTVGDLGAIDLIAMGGRSIVSFSQAKKKLQYLPKRLELFDKSLEHLLGLRADESGMKPVVAMLYPSLLYHHVDGVRQLCRTGRLGMDVTDLLSIDAAKIGEAETVVEGIAKPSDPDSYNGLVESIRSFGEDDDGSWHVVAKHRDMFAAHGICAADPANSPNESGRVGHDASGHLIAAEEVTGIPYKILKTSRFADNPYSDDWRRYHPVDDFYPYVSRKTWFRTPNQDFLTIHYFKQSMADEIDEDEKRVSNGFLLGRTLGGAFHPTAEGHAHIADFVYCKARDVLFKGSECQPDKVSEYGHSWQAGN